MGSRDYRHREPKKTKKDTRKLPGLTITTTIPADVEVIKKGKKREEREDEEET